SILPMRPAALPVYQILPLGSSSSPCGPEFGVGSEYSLKRPVVGSRWPTAFDNCAVYQADPSRAAAGSCGNGRALGVIHSSNCTSTISDSAGAALTLAVAMLAIALK